MIVGLALSTLTAWPVIVVASGVAFLISETADWAVYTFSKRPLSQRIMISSFGLRADRPGAVSRLASLRRAWHFRLGHDFNRHHLEADWRLGRLSGSRGAGTPGALKTT